MCDSETEHSETLRHTGGLGGVGEMERAGQDWVISIPLSRLIAAILNVTCIHLRLLLFRVFSSRFALWVGHVFLCACLVLRDTGYIIYNCVELCILHLHRAETSPIIPH